MKLSIADALASLPSPSPVLRRIAQIAGSPDSSASELADALKLDPAIAARVLRLANSAYIGLPRTVSSLQNAVVLLGITRIRSLVITSGLTGSSKLDPSVPFTNERFWRHSSMVGIVAESIARHLRRYDPLDEDEVFASAILHDIGKLVAAICAPSSLKLSLDNARERLLPLHLAEPSELSHTAFGEAASLQWHFPPELHETLAHHHDLAVPDAQARLVSIVQVADFMVHVLGAPVVEGEMPPELKEEALGRIQLPPERLKVIAGAALDDQRRCESLLEVFGGTARVT